MSDLTWRMIRERIARCEATGVLCPEDQVQAWLDRLEALPLIRELTGTTVRFYNGATVSICTTPDQAQSRERAEQRRVLWIDEANLLDAPLPAPKRDGDS